MVRAFMRAADIAFPTRCIRCDGVPQAVYDIDARRGIDVVAFAGWEILGIPAPICLSCMRRRRVVGIAVYVGHIILVLGGVVLAMVYAIEDKPVLATIFGAVAGLGFIGGRLINAGFLDWTLLGVRAKLLWGEPQTVRLSFRRAAYWDSWREVNPSAALSRDLLSQPAMTESVSAQSDSSSSRKTPVVTLALSLIMLALHHWYAMTQREVFIFLYLAMSALAGFALAGVIYPPVFHSVGKHGKHLPKSYRIIAFMAAVAGFAAGFYFGLVLYPAPPAP
jgi:hypothetical protein